ncbi:hypothetical protein OIU79_006404 [Salix purpurea]|uniref:Uncharacterized protein n=1 Tax=Salix purpurea TaxID=77065 RepID=A0A9Q0TVF2_SALPP|nr:hypothetical protein OIU79_006404 [Salix purpurea]
MLLNPIYLNLFFAHCSPIFTHSDGRTSVWKALSPQVLEASFKVSPDVEQLFRAKRMDPEIFFPPPKARMHSFILHLSVMAIRVCRVLYESYPSLH